MRSLSVIFILCLSLILISNNEIYIGFMLMLFAFITVIKYAASSVYGDFSRTAEEIKSYVKLQEKKPSFDYLSYPEQKAAIEEIKKQDVIDRKRKSAENKLKAKRTKRVYRCAGSTNTSLDVWGDDLTSINSISSLFDSHDEYFIHNTISDESNYEVPLINPSSGLPMLSTGNSGMAAVDVGGNLWGQSDLLDDSFSDSFSSIDDSFSSFDDSNDCFSSGMDDW